MFCGGNSTAQNDPSANYLKQMSSTCLRARFGATILHLASSPSSWNNRCYQTSRSIWVHSLSAEQNQKSFWKNTLPTTKSFLDLTLRMDGGLLKSHAKAQMLLHSLGKS